MAEWWGQQIQEPVTTVTPLPDTQSSPQNSQPFFNTGYPGTQGGVGSPAGGMYNLGGGFPWDAYRQANDQAQRAAEQGLQALQGGMVKGSPFDQQLGSIFGSPYGLPPELMAKQRQMLADTSAGSRENALMRSKQSAQSKGFGDSMGAVRAQDMIRTQSASDLERSMNELAIQDALLQMQRQMGAGGLMMQGRGIDAGLLQSYAQGQLGRQFPIMPGGMGGQGGGQGGFMGSGQPWDPFLGMGYYQGGAQGGYTPQNPFPVFKF
jgi:hypothetical protein